MNEVKQEKLSSTTMKILNMFKVIDSHDTV